MSKEDSKYYVYAHRKKTDDEIFYIGQGHGRRANRGHGAKRTKYWEEIANKHGYYVEYLEQNLSREESCEKEKEWIKKIGLDNLCNISEGGVGGNNISHHPERDVIIEKISLANRGSKNSNYKGKFCTLEWRHKQSASNSKVPLIVVDTITGEEKEYMNSKEVAKAYDAKASNVRMCKSTGHKLKRRYLIKSK